MRNIEPNNLTKIKKLEKQLTAAIFLFFILIISFLVMYDSDSAKEASAVTAGNYNKNTGDSLTINDWKNLPVDFVNAEGDTMTGNLILNNKLGIGASSPNSQIHVYNASGDNAEIDLQSVSGAGNHWGIYNERSNNSLNFWRGNNKMVITADGKVGIGTDDPGTDYKLAVVGQTRLSSSVGQLRLTNNTGTYPNVDFTVNSDGKLDIEGGNVGIGVANPQAKLDVGGDIAVNGRSYIKVGSVNYGAGSSYEKRGKDILDLKSIVGSLENAKKCLVFVVSSKAEYNYDYKAYCRVDSNGFIDAALVQDGDGQYDGNVTCGYICSATTDQNVVYY